MNNIDSHELAVLWKQGIIDVHQHFAKYWIDGYPCCLSLLYDACIKEHEETIALLMLAGANPHQVEEGAGNSAIDYVHAQARGSGWMMRGSILYTLALMRDFPAKNTMIDTVLVDEPRHEAALMQAAKFDDA